MKLSALAVDLGDEIAELDVNPLFVFPEGSGIMAADALVRPRAASARGAHDAAVG